MEQRLYNNLIPASYAKKGQDAINARNNAIQNLLYHRKIPEEGWNNKAIEDLMFEIQDLRNNTTSVNEIIARRNYNLFAGASPFYSQDTEVSEGSAKISHLANSFTSDLITTMGIKKPFNSILVPVATGMSLIFSMLSFRSLKPSGRYVIWSRIDQKSCFKSIISVGFIPIIIDTICINGECITDIAKMEKKIMEIGKHNINCVMSTTSCFAPRACDDIKAIAELCEKHNIFHLVNNAYGLSNRSIMKRINNASLKGRIDVFVQSSDKNLCVPVGGAIIVSFNKEIFKKLGEICLEKMSTSAAIDVVITLLAMGKKKYLKMIEECEVMFEYSKQKMLKLAEKYGEEVIENPGNPISIALTLNKVPKVSLTQIGSMLYTRNISGARVITADEVKTICGYRFERWGAHSNDCKIPYLTAAASIGILKSDVDIFIGKLDKIFVTLCNDKKST